MIEGKSEEADLSRMLIGLVGVEIGVWVGMGLIDEQTSSGWLGTIGWPHVGSLAAEVTIGSIWIRWVAARSTDLYWFGGGMGTEGGGLCLGSGLGVVQRGCGNVSSSAMLMFRRAAASAVWSGDRRAKSSAAVANGIAGCVGVEQGLVVWVQRDVGGASEGPWVPGVARQSSEIEGEMVFGCDEGCTVWVIAGGDGRVVRP
ncbi:hypothetical protein M0R45_009536 [Rubus argutus]|uniref:Uncharacterized protein n=1 Tax=Rubus argutus TaxID=59490 RepID=A0AAW1Y508_RUBAR